MPATIRLKRMGRKKQPYYRIVVADESSPRDGPPVDKLGVYNPRTEPAVVRLDAARALYWLNEGATPSHTVRSLFRRTGIWEKFHAGVTAETLEETVIHLGPAVGEDKTTQRVSAPPKKPKVKTPPAAQAAPTVVPAAEAVETEAAEAVEDVAAAVEEVAAAESEEIAAEAEEEAAAESEEEAAEEPEAEAEEEIAAEADAEPVEEPEAEVKQADVEAAEEPSAETEVEVEADPEEEITAEASEADVEQAEEATAEEAAEPEEEEPKE